MVSRIGTERKVAECSLTDRHLASGHPALTIPVGFSPAQDDPSIRLPVGMQLVGRKFEDVLLLKIAASWEKHCDWKS